MDVSTFFAFASFVTATTITPGPNSIMIMASGANFGFSRTLPHLLGVALGVCVLITLVGVGLTNLLDAVPFLHTGLLTLSSFYLLYLAWRIANAVPPKDGSRSGRPFSFFQAAAFQWVNPKVWGLGLTAITLYAPEKSLTSVAVIAFTFGAVGLSSNSLWAWSGMALRDWLSDGNRLRIFNITMAILLVASLYPILRQ